MQKVKSILYVIAVLLLLLVIMAVAVPKFTDVEYRAVLTGSMTPEIPAGSLVVIVPTAADEIQLGDDITFVSQGDIVVTHRVVSIDRERNEFTTWGIANPSDALDPPNEYKNIIGVVRYHIPAIGIPINYLSTTTGKIITVTAIIAIFILTSLLDVAFRKKNA